MDATKSVMEGIAAGDVGAGDIVADEKFGGVVETDLACAGCGYNLRTAAWAGVCPECGLAVERSRLPEDLRFESIKAIRVARWAVGLGVLAALLPTLADIGNVVLYWNIDIYWQDLKSPRSTMLPVYILSDHLRGWMFTAAYWLTAAALLLFVLSVRPRRRRLRWWMLGAAVAAAVGSDEDVVSFAARLVGSITGEFYLAWSNSVEVILIAAFLPAWIYLTQRLRERHRSLRLTMWLLFGLLCLDMLLNLSSVVVYLVGSRWIILGTNLYQSPVRAVWEQVILKGDYFWKWHAETPMLLAAMVALWLYLRVLNGALRKAERRRDSIIKVD